jgi:Rrf2 family nitric oxide-sensitive transcriptional repressor
MRLNKSTGHAIRIMIECCRAEARLVKVADLATSLDLTMQNVFKIVHMLSRAGLLAGARGRHGGVGLARPAEEIRLGDIVRAMETMSLSDDDRRSLLAEDGTGGGEVNGALELALEAFIDVLDRHTLVDMAGNLPPAAGATEGKPAATTGAARNRRRRTAAAIGAPQAG